MSPQNPIEPSKLEKTIDGVFREMEVVPAESPEFDKMSDQLVKLMELQANIGPKRISPDVKATILANLAGILVIVGHERVHIISTKALGFVKKLW